jgi:hypothetical protein
MPLWITCIHFLASPNWSVLSSTARYLGHPFLDTLQYGFALGYCFPPHGVGWDRPLDTELLIGLLYQPQMLDEYEAFGGIWIRQRNQSNFRKPAPVPLCPLRIPHDMTWIGPGLPWWEVGDWPQIWLNPPFDSSQFICLAWSRCKLQKTRHTTK